MMNDLEGSDEEDARKPAARPRTCTTGNNVTSPFNLESIASPTLEDRLTNTTHSNDRMMQPKDEINNGDDTSSTVIQSVAGELPFLITHWLSGYSQTSRCHNNNNINDAGAPMDSGTVNTSLRSDAAQNAAMKQIHKATTDLAMAFQTLGAFGTTRKVCGTNFCCFSSGMMHEVLTTLLDFC